MQHITVCKGVGLYIPCSKPSFVATIRWTPPRRCLWSMSHPAPIETSVNQGPPVASIRQSGCQAVVNLSPLDPIQSNRPSLSSYCRAHKGAPSLSSPSPYDHRAARSNGEGMLSGQPQMSWIPLGGMGGGWGAVSFRTLSLAHRCASWRPQQDHGDRLSPLESQDREGNANHVFYIFRIYEMVNVFWGVYNMHATLTIKQNIQIQLISVLVFSIVFQVMVTHYP